MIAPPFSLLQENRKVIIHSGGWVWSVGTGTHTGLRLKSSDGKKLPPQHMEHWKTLIWLLISTIITLFSSDRNHNKSTWIHDSW